MSSSNTSPPEPAGRDFAAEVLRWTEGTDAVPTVPAQGPLLGFRDPLLERAYLQAEHRRSRRYFAISMVIVTALVASFLWTDPWLLPGSMQPLFHTTRLFVMVPLCVLLTVNALWITTPLLWIRQTAVLTTLFSLVHPILLLLGGSQVHSYLELGILELTLGTPLLLGLPLRWSVSLVALFGLTFGSATIHVMPGTDALTNFVIDYSIFATLSIAAAYRQDQTARREFVARALSRRDYAQRLASDADRKRWLEVIAAFLRHELRNAIAGVRTSLDLAHRAASPGEVHKYLDRGRVSVHYMQVLLDKVADATNLESALAQHRFTHLNLSELVELRVEDFRADVPDRDFTLELGNEIEVEGHPESLLQMLDKLLNNALEHGSPEHPIRVSLSRTEAEAELVVEDIGDSLPSETQIFQPFVTHKARRSGTSHLGLGLFVARAIAENHRGQLRAEPLLSGTGARFRVTLPLSSTQIVLNAPSSTK